MATINSKVDSDSGPAPELNNRSNKPIQIQSPFQKLISCFVLVCVFVVLIYAGIGLPYYPINDDILMSMVSSGVGFVDSPDDHLIYTHFWIGRFLNNLYHIAPAIPWYGLYLIASQIAAITAITFVIENKFSSDFSLIPAGILLAIVVNPLFSIQFTVTATLVGTAGLILTLYALEHFKLRKVRILYGLVAIAFIAYSSMIRSQSAFLVLLVLSLIVLLKFFRHRKLKTLVLHSSIPLIAIVFVGLLQWINWAHYQSEQWRTVYPHIAASWRLINTNRLNIDNQQTTKALKSVGWTSLDREMYLTWFPLGEKFSTENLTELNKNLPSLNPNVNLELVWESIHEALAGQSILPMLFVFALSPFLLSRSKLNCWQTTLLLLVMLAIVFCLIAAMKLPPRVAMSLLLLNSIVLLYCFSPKRLRNIFCKNKIRIALSSLVVFVYLLSMINSYRQGASKRAEFRVALKNFNNKLKVITESNEKPPLFLVWGASYPFEQISPLDDLRSYFGQLKFTGFNSLDYSPLIVNRLKEYGISQLSDCIGNKDVVLIANDYIRTTLEAYCIESLNVRPEFKKIAFESNPRVIAYKVSTTGDTARPDTDQSPECPRLKGSDLILLPHAAHKKPSFYNVEPLAKSDHNTKFSIKGREAIIGLGVPEPINPNKISHFVIETQLNENVRINRIFSVWLRLDGDRRYRRFFIRLLPDGSMHRYSYDLRSFNFKKSDRIIAVFLSPFFGRASSIERDISISRVGLVKKTDDN